LPDLLLTRLDFNEKYEHSSEAEEFTNPKVVVKLPFRGETILVPVFLTCTVFFLTSHFVPSFGETVAQ
jgi:hypothetical protein